LHSHGDFRRFAGIDPVDDGGQRGGRLVKMVRYLMVVGVIAITFAGT
jgi:hypothetical protein